MISRFFDQARASLALGWLLDNPLFTREIRRRMRNKLLSWSLILYLLALAGVSSVIMLVSYPAPFGSSSLREKIEALSQVGRNIFVGMCIVEGVIALVVAPMLTAGLAVAEKERDTFDFLRVTTLRARTFVAGCLLTTAAFLLLSFSCTLPILALTFIFGGVAMDEILAVHAFLFLVAMAICAWGVAVSTAQVRARGMQTVSLIFLLIVFIFGSRLMLRFLSGSWVALGAAGPWRVVGATFITISGLVTLFSIVAARRLYDPQNRLINYRQGLLIAALLLGGMASWIAWRVGPLQGSAPLQGEIAGLLLSYFLVGWLTCAAGVVLFGPGLPERGDEVWRLRMRFPVMQRIDERLVMYGLLVALWLGSSHAAAQAWGVGTAAAARMTTALPLLAVSLLLIMALARLCTRYAPQRNKATMALVGILAVLWGGMPALGLLAQATLDGGGTEPSLISAVFYAFSPITVLASEWGGGGSVHPLAATALALVLAAAALVASMAGHAGRETVSYSWTSAAEAREG